MVRNFSELSECLRRWAGELGHEVHFSINKRVFSVAGYWHLKNDEKPTPFLVQIPYSIKPDFEEALREKWDARMLELKAEAQAKIPEREHAECVYTHMLGEF